MGLFSNLRLYDFCMVFSLQSGVVITMTVGTTIVLVILLFTLYLHIFVQGLPYTTIAFAVIMVHCALMLVGFFCAFIGAYRESSGWMMLAAMFVFFGFVIYALASIMSFIPAYAKYVCLQYRCPDHIWLQKSYWRDFTGRCKKEQRIVYYRYTYPPTTPPPITFIVDKKRKMLIKKGMRGGREDRGGDYPTIPPVTLQFDEELREEEHCNESGDRNRCQRSIEEDMSPSAATTPSLEADPEAHQPPTPSLNASRFSPIHHGGAFGNASYPSAPELDTSKIQVRPLAVQGGNICRDYKNPFLIIVTAVLTFFYTFFLIYTIVVYIAFSNELDDAQYGRRY